jgi:subtilisin family serine protease
MGEGTVIGVLDSGVEHNRLAPGQVAGAWTDDPWGTDPFSDQVGHGTMVALLATARESFHGFNGVAPGAEIFILAPRGENGVLRTGGILRSMDHILGWAILNQRRVILNNSWGLFGCESLLLP